MAVTGSSRKVRAITVHSHLIPAATAPDVPRAMGELRIGTTGENGITRLKDLRQAGSLKVLFPRTDTDALQGVVVNTAGGITGGDRFDLSIHAGQGSRLTVSTQAAERAYRAQAGQTGHVDAHVTVAADAVLHWLPQELILFEGCNIARRLRIDLDPGARLLMAETLAFGRLAMGEGLRDGALHDRIEISRGEVPIYADAIRMQGNIEAQLDRPTVADGGRAICTLVYVAPDAEAALASMREALGNLDGATGGASLLHPDVMVMRAIAADTFEMRRTLVPILTDLSAQPLPRPWMI